MPSAQSRPQPLRVQIVLFDGFDLLDALAPYETFLAAADECPGLIDVQLVAADGPRHVPCGLSGLLIHAAGALDPGAADLVVLPGAAGKVEGEGPDSIPALLNSAATSSLAPLMAQALARPDLIVATVCGGSLILAMAGLITGRHAVTHHLGMGLLEAAGVRPIAARVVDDGNLVTAGGVTSGLDISMYLLERLLGPQIAHSVESLFDYERRGTVWKPSGIKPRVAAISAVEPEPILAGNDSAAVAREGKNAGGMWDVRIYTPVGVQDVVMTIADEAGQVQGASEGGGESNPFISPHWVGDELLWEQRVSKPMKLKLKFRVRVSGDTLQGSAKAGVLPAVKVMGKRRQG